MDASRSVGATGRRAGAGATEKRELNDERTTIEKKVVDGTKMKNF